MISKMKARIIAERLIDNGMDATAAVKSIEPRLKERGQERNAVQKATRALASANVQQSVKEVLQERGLTTEWTAGLLKRNAEQSRQLAASNTALELTAKMRGDFAPDKSMSVNIDIPADPQKLEEAIQALQEKLARLND